MTVGRTDPAFFEAKYTAAEGHDPWRFATDPYEQGRYRVLVAALGADRFERAFEPGCSIGAFTRHLAPRCRHVDAIDFAPSAIVEAERRNADLGGVIHEVGAFPDWAVDNACRYDLVCLVEIGYYFDADELATHAASVVDHMLTDDGTVLAGHWTGDSPDHVLPGVEVHDIVDSVFCRHGLVRVIDRQWHDGFVVDCWTAADRRRPGG